MELPDDCKDLDDYFCKRVSSGYTPRLHSYLRFRYYLFSQWSLAFLADEIPVQ